MGEPHAPTLGKGKDRVIPLLCWSSPGTAAVTAVGIILQ